MIKKEICTYEVAKLAKEKGFPQQIGDDAYIVENEYDDEYEVGCHYPIPFIPDYLPTITAPTQSLLQRWLRKEKGIEVYVRHFEETNKYPHHFGTIITDDKGETLEIGGKMFDSYELALEDALKYALENLV